LKVWPLLYPFRDDDNESASYAFAVYPFLLARLNFPRVPCQIGLPNGKARMGDWLAESASASGPRQGAAFPHSLFISKQKIEPLRKYFPCPSV
ncbi:MAG: hypothetical protein V3T83_08290, partial [Acidobacteriota bacterium]